jgi:hypothetical protein|tara:strand:+ start:357 stop:518 length:162 start_codon:yes stop_codon:yes gene_type:complete
MITELGINKLITEVSHLIDNEIDGNGNGLTNETLELLQIELIYLNSKKDKLFG